MMSADMNNFNAFIAFLCILAISVEFCNGSVSVTRVLNVGGNMTLDCVTDWDPDINMYWIRRKLGSDQYLAQAGISYSTVEIYKKFRYDPRISVSYYSLVNPSSDIVSKILVLSISNITEQDSAEYICTSTNVPNSKTRYLYFYNIRVVTCNCSIDTHVSCDLIGFNTPQWQPVTIIFTGGTVKTAVNGNRLEFSPEHVNGLAHEHSIHVSSDDGLLSDITCILPVQSNPSSTQRTTTTVLSSQPRQSSAQGTTRIIDRTFSLIFSNPIPLPPRTTENVNIQWTSSTKMQEQTVSTRLKTISNAISQSPLAVNASKATTSVSNSSPSQPTSTVRTSNPPMEAQPRSTQSRQTKSPSTLTVTALETSERDESSTKDMNTKLNIKRASELSLPQTKKISTSSQATLSTLWTTNQKTIKEESDFNNIIIALCVSILAGIIFLAVIILMKFWRRYYKSSNLDTIEDCSDSTDRNFSTHAIHLNHEYESTIPIVQTSISTEVEYNALAYPSSFLPLTATSPTSQDYEEVGNNLQENKDADDYTFPYVRGKDTEGYVVMVSNAKDEDVYGYTVPNVTFHNIIGTTSIDNTDEDDYLVPSVRCCKGRPVSSTLLQNTHTYVDQEGEGYIVPTANRATTIDNKDENDYLVPNFRLCNDKLTVSTSDEGGRTETTADHQKKTKIVPTFHKVDEDDYLVPNTRL